jgi:Domain of unknown function (DUF4202)
MNEVMSEDNGRLANVIEAIDGANARDPNKIEHEGRLEPAELVYGWRMSATLARMSTEAPVHLRIAARGQHIERWTVHRNSYPAGRIGYLRWRRDLQDFHANRIGEVMAIAGYDAAERHLRHLLRVRPRPIARLSISRASFERADQEKDRKKAGVLSQKIIQLQKLVGPEFFTLANIVKHLDLNSPDGRQIASIIQSLNQSCPD